MSAKINAASRLNAAGVIEALTIGISKAGDVVFDRQLEGLTDEERSRLEVDLNDAIDGVKKRWGQNLADQSLKIIGAEWRKPRE